MNCPQNKRDTLQQCAEHIGSLWATQRQIAPMNTNFICHTITNIPQSTKEILKLQLQLLLILGRHLYKSSYRFYFLKGR